MEKIEEIKSLIVQLENKLEELKNQILTDEVLISKEEFGDIELITEDENNYYLKFKEFRFHSGKYKIPPVSLHSEIVKDIKNHNLKSFKLKKLESINPNSKIGLNSYIVDVTRKL